MTELSEQLRRTTTTADGDHEHVVERPAPRAEPVLVGGLPGRTALLERLVSEIAVARASGTRLALAVLSVGQHGPAERAVADTAQILAEVSGEPVHRTGPTSLAVVLPGRGRAEALAVIARTEATLRSRTADGRPALHESAAVELGPDEDAVALLARIAAA